MRLLALFAALFLQAGAVMALSAEPPLADAAQEARARALFSELRCMVCAGESIADSPADVAAALRQEVRTQITDGKSDEAILAGLAEQYGIEILMTPQVEDTMALWLGPLVMLLGASMLAVWYFRAERKAA